ncbi:MAG: hypothetical protein U5K37_09265 [Natrialbaceae archaeon]|nr:hypothetical protein [Natrialbaceae archaeon]
MAHLHETRERPQTIRLDRIDEDGNAILLDQVESKFPTDEWVTIETVWGQDGTIRVNFVDESGAVLYTLEGTDSTYAEGGIGFGHSQSWGGDREWFVDNLRVTDS